jgi:small GTP-binding protein
MEPSSDARPLSGALPEAARDLLQRERAALGDLRAVVARAELGGGGERAIATALEDLEGLFLLVVVGEFNAGKSTLINAMLGAQVMREGVTPTTDRVTLIVHGERETTTALSAELVRMTHPAPRLRALALVDTPGTNAVITHHQVLTERFVPRSDLVLFVTSSDRPFTESERSFLQRIAEWGKKVAVVVNKADLLEDEAGPRGGAGLRPRPRARHARPHARRGGRGGPRRVAARLAQGSGASTPEAEAALAATGLPALERLLADRVDVDRVRIKLEAGLGVAHHVARRPPPRSTRSARCCATTAARSTTSTGSRRSGRRTSPARAAPTSTASRPCCSRSSGVARCSSTTPSSSATADAAAPREGPRGLRGAGAARRRPEIDEAVAAMSDWFVERTLQQWEDVVAFVAERRKAGDERVVGEVGGRFRYDRAALIGALRERAEGVLEGYDVPTESRRLAEALQASVLQTGLLEVGGLGLGRRHRGHGDHDRVGPHRHRRRPDRDGPGPAGAAAPAGPRPSASCTGRCRPCATGSRRARPPARRGGPARRRAALGGGVALHALRARRARAARRARRGVAPSAHASRTCGRGRAARRSRPRPTRPPPQPAPALC